MILEAARNVFVKKGMDGARMQMIADKAGINKTLLHYYFRSKEKLFYAVFDQVEAGGFTRFSILIEAQTSFEEVLKMFIERYISAVMDNPYLPRFILSELNSRPEMLQSRMKNVIPNLEKIQEMIQTEINSGYIRPIHPVQLMINII